MHRTGKGRCKKKVIHKIYEEISGKVLEFSVTYLCKAYGVSRSGYYKWLKRKNTRNRYEESRTILDAYVSDIHAHYPSMGYRQIRDTLLLKTGWRVCDISVWRSMKRLNIKGYVRRRKYTANAGAEHKLYPNVLNREFHASEPLKKIVTDVTYIKHRGKWFFLVCFLDLFNNEVLEWELSNTFDNVFVINAAKRLLEKAKSTAYPILLHSDQGNQYSSSGYQALLQEYDAIQSMSRAGTPRDNAVMESFFGRLKDVLRFQFRYWEHDDLAAVISKAIYYFNNIRPVRKLNGKPPVLFRNELVA